MRCVSTKSGQFDWAAGIHHTNIYLTYDRALGISPVTSYSGMERTILSYDSAKEKIQRLTSRVGKSSVAKAPMLLAHSST